MFLSRRGDARLPVISVRVFLSHRWYARFSAISDSVRVFFISPTRREMNHNLCFYFIDEIRDDPDSLCPCVSISPTRHELTRNPCSCPFVSILPTRRTFRQWRTLEIAPDVCSTVMTEYNNSNTFRDLSRHLLYCYCPCFNEDEEFRIFSRLFIAHVGR